MELDGDLPVPEQSLDDPAHVIEVGQAAEVDEPEEARDQVDVVGPAAHGSADLSAPTAEIEARATIPPLLVPMEFPFLVLDWAGSGNTRHIFYPNSLSSNVRSCSRHEA